MHRRAQRPGKSTLLKIAAGLTEADKGRRFAQPGATIQYLSQEPDLSGFADTHSYVEAGLGAGDDPARAYYLLGQLGLSGAEPIARFVGWSGAQGGARPRAGAKA